MKKTRKDFSQIAFAVVQQATGQVEPEPKLEGKKADSSKGGKKGGKTRMEQLTKEQRSELAKKAAQARWNNVAPSTANATKPKQRLTKQR